MWTAIDRSLPSLDLACVWMDPVQYATAGKVEPDGDRSEVEGEAKSAGGGGALGSNSASDSERTPADSGNISFLYFPVVTIFSSGEGLQIGPTYH
jgi:hypothetical protein